MSGLTVTDYAAHRRSKGLAGCSRKSVYAALKRGWIVRDAFHRIDAARADRTWASMSRPRIDGQSAGSSASSEVSEKDLNFHRARKEKASADKLELANAQTRGELVDRAAIEAAWQSLGTLIRERLTALPAMLASRVAHCDDEHQVTLLMRVEIETVLNELGDDAPGLS